MPEIVPVVAHAFLAPAWQVNIHALTSFSGKSMERKTLNLGLLCVASEGYSR
jgi:hypothetical protein